jgi:uncharacterized protein
MRRDAGSPAQSSQHGRTASQRDRQYRFQLNKRARECLSGKPGKPYDAASSRNKIAAVAFFAHAGLKFSPKNLSIEIYKGDTHMPTKVIKSALVLALFIAGWSVTAIAQSTISPEKRALIKEMIEATDVQKTGDTMIKAIIDQMEKDAPQRVTEIVNARTDLTPQEREKMILEVTAADARFTRRFRELLKEKLNWPQMMDELLYPIVDKYYTEDDLRNIIAFYKSPTGRKMLADMPQMMTDIILKSEEIVRPKVMEISKQILDEEAKRHRQ